MDGNDLRHGVEPAADFARPLRRVIIKDLEIVASVGVYEHEHRYLQRVLLNLELDVRDHYDGKSDRLSDVYDYDEAIRAAQSVLDEGHINLIETAAERIAERCLDNPVVQQVKIRVEKPDVISACRAVGIEVVRARLR